MKKITLFTFFALSFLANVSGFNTFERSYVKINLESGNCVRQTSDGGFIIGALLNGNQIFLLRTNQNGDTIWTRRYDGICYDIQEDQEGNFILCGDVSSNALVMKINSVGDLLWSHQYGGFDDEKAYSFVQTSNKQIIFCGYSKSSGSTNFNDLYYVKIDSVGNVIWEKFYQEFPYSYGIAIRKINNDYLICGNAGEISKIDFNNVLLLKINENGDTIWTSKILGLAFASSFSVTDDGIMTCGYIPIEQGNAVDLEKFDFNGIHLWSKVLNLGSANSEANWLENASNGNFILTGKFGNSMLIIKTDANGDTLWTRKYNNSTIAKGNFVQSCSNGGFVACGSSGTSATSFNVYLVRTDDSGLITGIGDKGGFGSDIKVYPNPFNQYINIIAPQIPSPDFDFKIIDMTGKVVHTGKAVNGHISTNQLTFGSYVITIERKGRFNFSEVILKK